MISFDLYQHPNARPETAAAFLYGVLNKLRESSLKSCTVRVSFGPEFQPHKFRISYVGPSRRASGNTARRPSMAGKKSRSK